jgi:thiol-disulfide isomerase/thioredoxin
MSKVLTLVLVAALLWSCQSQPADQIRLTGTISNADTLLLKFVEGQKSDVINIADGGVFAFEKVSTKPVSGYLNIGKKYLSVYLIPGKELTVTVDYSNWDSTLVFGGNLKPVADYMAEKSKVMRAWSKGFMSVVVKDPAGYRESRDSLAGVSRELLAKYESVRGFDPVFAGREKLSVQFEQIMDLKNFSVMHKYYAKKDTVILPDNWNDLEKDLNLNDPALLNLPAAMQYLSSHINESAQKEAGLVGDVWGKPEFLTAKFNFIKKTFTHPEMVEAFMYSDLAQQIDGASTKGIDAQLAEYFAMAKNLEQIAEIRKKAAEWDAILPGKQAPDFTVVDMSGKEYTLSQFKGKYVFIDFWATWCGPCKQEIPFLKKMYEDYQKKNIVIMSISIDQDKKEWEKMVTEEGFAWLQLHDGNKENDKYVVRYIPSFILIDMDGKIIDPRAPNPSDPKLREMIDALSGL